MVHNPGHRSSALLRIEHANQLLAIILRASYKEPGIHFFTPNDLSQQLAFMRHPSGKVIEPHIHNSVERRVQFTQEALFVRKGRLRVDFYSDAQDYLESYELNSGDVVLLIRGGHGFQALEETEFIEVKQGPYAGDHDKRRFSGVPPDEVKWAE
jgi:mannose-6-phosphate isomerase-like protein (cupin superfamily)